MVQREPLSYCGNLVGAGFRDKNHYQPRSTNDMQNWGSQCSAHIVLATAMIF